MGGKPQAGSSGVVGDAPGDRKQPQPQAHYRAASKADSPRVIEETGVVAQSYPPLNRRLVVFPERVIRKRFSKSAPIASTWASPIIRAGQAPLPLA